MQWEAQKNLHTSMVNPFVKKLEDISYQNGAIGLKLNGAGGGGSATILTEVGTEQILKNKLLKRGFRPQSIKVDLHGVQSTKGDHDYHFG